MDQSKTADMGSVSYPFIKEYSYLKASYIIEDSELILDQHLYPKNSLWCQAPNSLILLRSLSFHRLLHLLYHPNRHHEGLQFIHPQFRAVSRDLREGQIFIS